MLRYTVIKTIKHKGEIYEPGDLLPATFTKKDKERHLWSRRIVPIEVADEVDEVEGINMADSETIEISKMINPPIEVNKIAENKDIQNEISDSAEVKPEIKTSTPEIKKVISPSIPVKQVATKK